MVVESSTTTSSIPSPPDVMKALPDGPTDGITSLCYLPPIPGATDNAAASGSLLASTSWDGCLRIHDTKNRILVRTQTMDSGPLLCSTTTSGGGGSGGGTPVLITGGMDGSIRLLDLEQQQQQQQGVGGVCAYQIIGRHENAVGFNSSSGLASATAVSCLASVPAYSVIASAGWHRQCHLWDLRQHNHQEGSMVKHPSAACTVELPGKAFCMDVDPERNRLVIGTSGRRLCWIDVRKTNRPVTVEEDPTTRPTASAENRNDDEAGDDDSDVTLSARMVLDRESSLKYQTRTVRYFVDGTAIAIGSVEGRVAVEYMDELGLDDDVAAADNDDGEGGPATATITNRSGKKDKKKFAFKCHRVNDVVYPVNAIAFHPRFGTFATGGCDGTVVTWDGWNKKKLTSFPTFPTSISSLAFNHDGSELAIASSYTFEDGEREHPRDEIYIRTMSEAECMPKNAPSSSK